MPSMKMIRRRLASVTTTKKIMKAMHMVAASKLQRNRARLEEARPFFEEAKRLKEMLSKTRDTICEFSSNAGARPLSGMAREELKDNILFTPRDLKNTVHIVVTGDRGLCGSFNSNITGAALAHMKKSGSWQEGGARVIAVGLKACEFFRRQGTEIICRFNDILETAFYEDAAEIARYIIELYASGSVNEIYMAYTRFESVLVHSPQVVRLLPLGCDADTSEEAGEMKYDPDFRAVLEQSVPMCLSAVIYAALLESSACEQAARMVSMDAAEKNAAEIIDKLTRIYNRRRQSAITQEISEVVSGSNV